jgi:cytoskeletal protein RodZ
MTSNPDPATGEDDTTDAGSSTDQHVTGPPETGTFLEDTPTEASTPVHGSSNAGVNAVGGTSIDLTDDTAASREDA